MNALSDIKRAAVRETYSDGLTEIVTGGLLFIVALAMGAVLYVKFRRSKEAQGPQEIVQKIDLSGDIELEKLKCQNCGAELSKDSVTVREGAVFISCPYCGAAYQMVEEPKW